MADRDHFRNGVAQVSIAIMEFHLNHLDVLHNTTHSEIAVAMDLHQNKTWRQRGILAQLYKLHLWTPPQLQVLSADVNADSLLVLSDLRWRYSTANCLIKARQLVRLPSGGTSTTPRECVWKAQIEPFPWSPGSGLIVCKIQSRLCIICKYYADTANEV